MSKNVVIVTGGSRGIGYEIVKLFLENSYSVIYTYLHRNENMDKLKDIVSENNVIFESYRLDISNSKEVKQFKNWFIEKEYNLIGLVNNAGITM